jgi:hypothetical protein
MKINEKFNIWKTQKGPQFPLLLFLFGNTGGGYEYLSFYKL